MTAHSKEMIAVSIINRCGCDLGPYRRNLLNLLHSTFCLIYRIYQQVGFLSLVIIVDIFLPSPQEMIVKHGDFHSLVITVQIGIDLICCMLLELINEITICFQHIFFIICTFPESWITKNPLDFLGCPVYLYHRFQIADAEQNGICLRLIGNCINMCPVNQIFVFTFNNILKFQFIYHRTCLSVDFLNFIFTVALHGACKHQKISAWLLLNYLMMTSPGKIIHVVSSSQIIQLIKIGRLRLLQVRNISGSILPDHSAVGKHVKTIISSLFVHIPANISHAVICKRKMSALSVNHGQIICRFSTGLHRFDHIRKRLRQSFCRNGDLLGILHSAGIIQKFQYYCIILSRIKTDDGHSV